MLTRNRPAYVMNSGLLPKDIACFWWFRCTLLKHLPTFH